MEARALAAQQITTTALAAADLHNNTAPAAQVRTVSSSCLLAKRSAVSSPRSLPSSAVAVQNRRSSTVEEAMEEVDTSKATATSSKCMAATHSRECINSSQ